MKHVDNITSAAPYPYVSEIGNWCISMPLLGKVIYYPIHLFAAGVYYPHVSFMCKKEL